MYQFVHLYLVSSLRYPRLPRLTVLMDLRILNDKDHILSRPPIHHNTAAIVIIVIPIAIAIHITVIIVVTIAAIIALINLDMDKFLHIINLSHIRKPRVTMIYHHEFFVPIFTLLSP